LVQCTPSAKWGIDWRALRLIDGIHWFYAEPASQAQQKPTTKKEERP
jgi:hypothetical protein